MYVDSRTEPILYGYHHFGRTGLPTYSQLIVSKNLHDYSFLNKFVYGKSIASRILDHHRP